MPENSFNFLGGLFKKKPPEKSLVPTDAPKNRTARELDAALRADPSLSHQLEYGKKLQTLNFETVRAGQIIGIRTEQGQNFALIVEKIEKTDDGRIPVPSGQLFVDPTISETMGIPPVIQGARLLGAAGEGFSSLWRGCVKQSMTVETSIPIKNLGAVIRPNDLKQDFNFIIKPVAAAVAQDIKALNPVTTNKIAASSEINPPLPTEAPCEVVDWPGKNQGITIDNIDTTLYLGGNFAGGSLRTRYWINPETEMLTKHGSYTVRPSVWEAIEENTAAFAARGNPMRLQRIAAFTFWTQRLGMQMPDSTREMLERWNLGFIPPTIISK